MPMKRFKAEQIVTLLRQIEVEIANGKTTPQACRDAQITVQTFYRWRKEYGGLKLDQAKRLKELEKENSKLTRLVAELSLEKQILKDVAEGNFQAWSGGVARSGMLVRPTGCRSGMPVGCWGSGEGRNATKESTRVTRGS